MPLNFSETSQNFWFLYHNGGTNNTVRETQDMNVVFIDYDET